MDIVEGPHSNLNNIKVVHIQEESSSIVILDAPEDEMLGHLSFLLAEVMRREQKAGCHKPTNSA